MMELPVLQERRFRPTIYWYSTFRCNLACKHCSVHSSPFVDTSWDLTTDEALQTVERIAEVNPSLVILTGGDPFIRKDMPQIIQALLDKQFRVGIESNGMLITDELAQQMADAVLAGRDISVAVSIDGGDATSHDFQRGTGSYELALRGIETLRKHGVPVQVQCVVNRVNIDTLPKLFSLAEHLDLYMLAFAFVNPVGRALEFLDQLEMTPADLERSLQLILAGMEAHPSVHTVIKLPPALIPPHLYPRFTALRNRRTHQPVALSTSCNFPLLGILPDGSVTVCSVTRTRVQAQMGNVKDESLVDIWQRNHFDEMRKQYVEATWLTGICGDCVFKKGCKGSCRAWAYMEYGAYSDPHPLCAALENAGLFPHVYRESHRNKLLAAARRH